MEIRHYITLFMKWWWLMIVLTVVAATSSYFISQRQTPIYEATVTIMVGQSIQTTNPNTADIQTSQTLARTYADMARRQPILQGVIDTLTLDDDWQGLKGRVRANPVPDTQLIEIGVEANSPEEARIIADEVSQQLIQLSPGSPQNEDFEEKQRFIQQRLEGLQAKIEAGQEKVEELRQKMDASPLPAQQVSDLQNQINILEGLIVSWESTFSQLLSFSQDRTTNFLALIEPAQADSDPVRPKILLNVVIAGVGGFLLSLGIILILELLDDTLKSRDDLRWALGLTALGTIGHLEGKHYHDQMVTIQNPFGSVSEAYQIIQSKIQIVPVDQPAKSILITSFARGEGKSITVANLGVVMAQAGFKTIIVDADLRQPVQHKIFQLPNTDGLANLLRVQKPKINNHLKETSVENLYLITSGRPPINPLGLLGSQRLVKLLAALDETADVVILDSPALGAVTDAVVISSKVDAVVLVTYAGRTRGHEAKQAILDLQQVGANLLGGVLNHGSNKRNSYSDNGTFKYLRSNGNR